MNTLSRHLAAQVTALRPDWSPAELSGFLYLEGGYSNDNYLFSYRGERYVLRTPFHQRRDVDWEAERAIYAALAPGIAPETVAFDARSGCLISRWIPGQLLADADVAPQTLTGYLTALHAQLPAIERAYDPIAEARRHLETCSAPAWLERAAGRLEWSPAVRASCHNDLNPWNVIRTEGGWITLDWEWAGRNDPLFDLVNLHQGAGLADESLPAMAAWYLAAPAEPDRLQASLVALWLRESAWALAEIESGNDRPEILAQRDTGLSRLRGLLGG